MVEPAPASLRPRPHVARRLELGTVVRHLAVLVLLPLALVGSGVDFEAGHVTTMALAFGFTLTVALLLLLRRDRGGVYRPSVAYLMVFGLFHGGLLLSVAVGGSAPSTAGTSPEIDFLYGSTAGEATELAIRGMASFALIAAAIGAFPSAARSDTVDPAGRRTFGVIGLALQAAGLAVFVDTVVRAGGLALLSGGYDAYLQVAQDDPVVGWGTFFLHVGAIMAIAAGGRPRTLAWMGFAVYALAAFPIGERGEVLFPLVALLVIEFRRGTRIPRWCSAAGALVALALIGIVRQSRLYGFGGLFDSSVVRAPIDAIAEMGYSLRPVIVVLGWHGVGEPFAEGATLMAVPTRFVENLTGLNGGPPAHDPRLFDVLVTDRIGPIGGSPIAEAFYNFGSIGVVLFMGALGLVIGLAERRAPTLLTTVQLGVVLLPLLIQIRNSFAPVPAEILVGLIVVSLPAFFVHQRKPSKPGILPVPISERTTK